MSRKNRAPKRDVLPDPLYNSQLVTRLINRVMLDGKRGTAASIVYGAFEQIKEATGNDALEVFETAMENIMPVLEVRARRVGGSNYQVPVEVRPERRTTLGLRWLVTIACIVCSPRRRAMVTNQRSPSVVRRSGRTSTGTW